MIVNFLQAILAFILVLGPLVFIHELGHFLAAKAFRIGVPVFSIGFGPRIFGFRRAETDYRLSLIPLGGYVRMSGDEADENRTGAPEEFLTRPKYQRFIVFVAGAVFNIVLAFFTMWFYFGVWGREMPQPYPVVTSVPAGTPAAVAGLEVGDTVLEIGGRDLDKGAFSSVFLHEVILAPGQTREVLVDRDGQRVALEVTSEEDAKFGIGRIGWRVLQGRLRVPEIDVVNPGTPAETAGFLPGDRVVEAEGVVDISETDFRLLIQAAADKPLSLIVDRSGERIPMTVTPETQGDRGVIGVLFKPPPREKLSLGEAAAESVRSNVELSKTLFVVLGRLVKRDVPLKSMSGPIGIAQAARSALFTGWDQFVLLLGFFSLQLGILNLLPIPVLDGGHILILLVEGVIRRDLPESVKERVMQAGFVFLLAFMGIIVVLDLIKTVT